MGRPAVVHNTAREARQRLVDAAPTVGDHSGVEEVAIELQFRDPEGRQHPSPRGMTFASHMRAYFQFSCPMRDCTDGGFDANADLLPALARKRNGHTGTISCHGNRPRGGNKKVRCDIELKYTLAIRKKAAA